MAGPRDASSDPKKILDDDGTVLGSFAKTGLTLASGGNVTSSNLGSYRVVWEWNGTDLEQFESKVEGSNVDSSTVQLTAYNGFNWVDISTTSDATATSALSTMTALPISFTPSSADYGIFCEMVHVTNGGAGGNYALGAGVMVRHDGTSNDAGYGFHLKDASTVPNTASAFKATATETFGLSFTTRPDLTNIATTGGISMIFFQEGKLSKLGWMGSQGMQVDTAGSTTDVNKAAVMCTCVDNATTTVKNYFRSIKIVQL